MYHFIVFLPLLGALIAGTFGAFIGARASEVITSGFVVVAALLSCVAFYSVGIGGQDQVIHVLTWMESGRLNVDWALRIDTLTAVMLVVVNGISALVHVYSIGYMQDDPHRARFFAYLSLFTFAMLMLVTSDNFAQMFFGWEGVGLCSYLLIGFWYKKPSANAAAIKAFLVNRVGDFGFALGIASIFFLFGTLNFDEVFAAAPEIAGTQMTFLAWQVDALTVTCLLLFMGAMGKSAQFLLHTWLPDAMEGPTPVSALIHAATMVTAGVFLVCRASPIFEFAPFALDVVTIVGATTAFFAATVGLFQNDIKRVIAYSTCSQLGYMFFAAGVSAYQVAMFHLFTHAFFKALLFLGAGAVIHAMHHEQDMRKMGGIYKMLPLTWLLMLIGTLALTGVGIPFQVFSDLPNIGLAGFFSKDAAIEVAYASGGRFAGYAFWMAVFAALMTAFYSFRLLFMTFHGPNRVSESVLSHVKDPPWVMTIPLILLAAGAVFAGALFAPYFIGSFEHEFWRDSIFVLPEAHILEASHHVPTWVKLSPLVVTVIGLMIAWYYYIRRPELPAKMAAQQSPLYLFLYNKWYFDELYNFLFVRPANWFGRKLWKVGDGSIIDGLGPDGISARVIDVTRQVVRLQSGYVYHYAFAMLLGVAAFVTWFMWQVAGGAS
ncbi:NADH-quinone oxidoreductase subunit L [bacterium AH-315-P15]|nr:NADH-quinone oxidoreductase subunit L [bacterium AH-315-P15]